MKSNNPPIIPTSGNPIYDILHSIAKSIDPLILNDATKTQIERRFHTVENFVAQARRYGWQLELRCLNYGHYQLDLPANQRQLITSVSDSKRGYDE